MSLMMTSLEALKVQEEKGGDIGSILIMEKGDF